MATETCATCRWWGAERAHRYDEPYGTCRGGLPAVMYDETRKLAYHDPDRPDAEGPTVYKAIWPWTAFDDFCGEHQPHEDADAPTA